jgi:ComF family protein
MNFLDTFIAYIAPHECLGCGFQGRLLCSGCSLGLPVVPEARLHSGGRVIARTTYDGLAKDLVWRLKAGAARSAADEIASLLLLQSGDVVVPIPTAPSRERQRGYDQAVLIAKAYAHRQGIPFHRHLARQSQTRQVGASRAQRLQQLAGAFRVVQQPALRGQRVILVDDVLTTGATLETAAQLLLAAGAKTVDAVVFAQA